MAAPTLLHHVTDVYVDNTGVRHQKICLASRKP
jgi:hypothetical protein